MYKKLCNIIKKRVYIIFIPVLHGHQNSPDTITPSFHS